MRAWLVFLLLLAVPLAGCIGADGFGEKEATDAFGNIYEVEDTEGTAPIDGEVVIGVSARDLVTKADALALLWSKEANLLSVTTLELVQGADGDRVFVGPTPEQYTLYDRHIGDGLAPFWNFVYTASDRLDPDDCEFLFVHVAYNGFAVSYRFDPGAADLSADRRLDAWKCDATTLADSGADWTVDSNDAASEIVLADDRFNAEVETSKGVQWALDIHPGAVLQADADFATSWFVLALPNLSRPLDPDVFFLCQIAGGSEPLTTDCYNEKGVNTKDLGANKKDTPPLKPESGSGQLDFGFVFSGPQRDSFEISEEGHPRLELDVAIDAEGVFETATVELLDPNDTVVDSFEAQRGGETAYILSADAPVTGTWFLRISGNAGTPAVEYRWCAQGFNHDTGSPIDCA